MVGLTVLVAAAVVGALVFWSPGPMSGRKADVVADSVDRARQAAEVHAADAEKARQAAEAKAAEATAAVVKSEQARQAAEAQAADAEKARQVAAAKAADAEKARQAAETKAADAEKARQTASKTADDADKARQAAAAKAAEAIKPDRRPKRRLLRQQTPQPNPRKRAKPPKYMLLKLIRPDWRRKRKLQGQLRAAWLHQAVNFHKKVTWRAGAVCNTLSLSLPRLIASRLAPLSLTTHVKCLATTRKADGVIIIQKLICIRMKSTIPAYSRQLRAALLHQAANFHEEVM